MKKENIIKYYHEVCKFEKIQPIQIIFCNVGKGGACVRYDVRTKKPLEIRIDLKRCHDIEWAILHETAHQVLLLKYGDPAQKHNLRFRKLQDIFIDKYMYSVLTWKYLAK